MTDGDEGSSAVAVDKTEIQALDRYCTSVNEREQVANIKSQENRKSVTIVGQVLAYKKCLELRLSVENGVGIPDMADDAINVDVEPTTPKENNDCEGCPAIIDYRAQIQLNKVPSSISVFHIKRTGEQEPPGTERVGPLAEANYSS
ncbi:hypothetical protein [Haloprofundus halophilus]|uniref:hypothetical protein n=1 Tax=Haloprofundus halophilus TaxID=2283527 RepID=UPI0013004380|nr:hypothetical protein [Haloprofundus halophilus]